jgi:hypothetical protein
MPLVRYSVPTQKDTLTWLRIPTLMPGRKAANPMPVNDDWALLSDGSVAIIRAADFHVDWIDPNGHRRSTGRVPFDWVQLSDDKKLWLADSLNAWYVAHPLRGVYITDAAAVAHLVTVPDRIPVERMPDYVPAFGGYTATGDRDGRVWIQVFTRGEFPLSVGPGSDTAFEARLPPLLTLGRSLRPLAGAPVYYLIDRDGAVVDRVQLPDGWALVGFGQGGIAYLRHDGPSNTWELGRARLR